MLKEDNFFKGYFNNSIKYRKNLKKTRKAFSSLILDLKSSRIPVLESYKKEYSYSFSNALIKKFYNCNKIIIIGMGGSILGTKSIYSFLKKKIKKKVFFFDNLDSNLYSKFKKIKNLKSSCFVVVSKSGNTLETITNLNILSSRSIFRKKLVIITEIKNNSLTEIASKYNAEIIEHKDFIGGRYSVLSETGMFPAALMGLKIKKFKNLEALVKNKNFVNSLIKNVAALYTLNTNGINNSITLNYDSSLNDLSFWYQQLVAESLGKLGKGINPIIAFGPKDHHSLLQLYLDGPKDKFFSFFSSSNKENKLKINMNTIPYNFKFLKNKNINSIVGAQQKALQNIFKLKKIPFRCINFNAKNEEDLGNFFTFFVLETILLSKLMNLNPFNQPAVEQVKIETKKILGLKFSKNYL
jgi:glucose-6-phosphate isomerase